MLQINQLLNRFKNLTNNEKFKKQLIVEILINNKIPISINQISVNKNTIFIKAQPIIKTEILLKKEGVIEQIKKISGFKNIKDII